MRWYVYALTDAHDDVPDGLRGIGDAPVGLVGAGPLRLVASAAPDDIDTLVEAAPEDVVAAVVRHDDVLLRLAATARTLAPTRFGTLVDEDRVGALLADPDGRLRSQLDALAGLQEWVVAVSTDDAGTPPSDDDGLDDLSPGHAFFARRRQAVDARTTARERAAAVAADVDQRLGAMAADFAQLDLRGDAMVARGAYLVPSAAAAAVHDVAAAATPGVVVTIEGPLPPYHFSGDLS